MSGLISRLGIDSRPSTFLSAADILRRVQVATSHSNAEASSTNHGDTDGVRSRASSPQQPDVIEDTQSDAVSIEFSIHEDCLRALSITRLPCLLLPCQVPDIIQLFAKGEPKYDEKSWGLVTMRDAGRWQPWWSTEASARSEEHTVTHVETSHADHPRDYGEEQRSNHNYGSDELPTEEDKLHGPVTINIASEESKRVISINSTSDTSTRRSFIWDQDRLDDEASDVDESDLTDISSIEIHSDTHKQDNRLQLEPADEQEPPHCFSLDFEKGPGPNEPGTSPLPSANPREPPDIQLPALRDAGVTMIRSPNRHRSSHEAVLPLQAENEHLRIENASLSDQLRQARAAIVELTRQNRTMSAGLEERDSPAHEVQEVLNTYEQLQIENKDLRSQSLALQDDNDCLRHEKRLLQRAYTAIRNHNSKLSSHHDQTEKVLDEAHAFIVMQYQRAKSFRAEVKSARHQTAQPMAEKEAVEGELLTTQRDLRTTAEELAATIAKSPKKESRLRLIETQLAATQHQLSAVQTDLGVTLRDLSSRQAELTATQYEVTTTQRKLIAAEDQVVATRDALATVQDNLTTTQLQLRDTEDRLGTTQHALDDNQKDLATATERVNTQNLLLSSLRKHTCFLEGWVESLHEERTALYEAKNVSVQDVEAEAAEVAKEERRVRVEATDEVEEVEDAEEVEPVEEAKKLSYRYRKLKRRHESLEQRYEGSVWEYKKLKRRHEVLNRVVEKVCEREKERDAWTRAKREIQLRMDLEGVIGGFRGLRIGS